MEMSHIAVRLPATVRDGLLEAASRRDRTPSGLLRIILVRWLAENEGDGSDDERKDEALRRIATWPQAYPLEVFPEPDEASYTKAREVLKANGLTLEAFTIAAMRHVIVRVGEIARAGLGEHRT